MLLPFPKEKYLFMLFLFVRVSFLMKVLLSPLEVGKIDACEFLGVSYECAVVSKLEFLGWGALRKV